MFAVVISGQNGRFRDVEVELSVVMLGSPELLSRVMLWNSLDFYFERVS